MPCWMDDWMATFHSYGINVYIWPWSHLHPNCIQMESPFLLILAHMAISSDAVVHIIGRGCCMQGCMWRTWMTPHFWHCCRCNIHIVTVMWLLHACCPIFGHGQSRPRIACMGLGCRGWSINTDILGLTAVSKDGTAYHSYTEWAYRCAAVRLHRQYTHSCVFQTPWLPLTCTIPPWRHSQCQTHPQPYSRFGGGAQQQPLTTCMPMFKLLSSLACSAIWWSRLGTQSMPVAMPLHVVVTRTLITSELASPLAPQAHMATWHSWYVHTDCASCSSGTVHMATSLDIVIACMDDWLAPLSLLAPWLHL